MPQRLPRCGVDAAVQTVLLFARTGREEEAACRLTQQAIAEPQTPQPVDLQYLAIWRLQPVDESSRGGGRYVLPGPKPSTDRVLDRHSRSGTRVSHRRRPALGTAGARFMGMQVANEDQYTRATYYGAGRTVAGKWGAPPSCGATRASLPMRKGSPSCGSYG
jgi:hypothetical protein